MRLPVYHILEPKMAAVVPKDIYEKNVGIWMYTVDVEEIGRRFQEIRKKAQLQETGE